MEPGRGEQIKLINPSSAPRSSTSISTASLPGGPRGKLHHHSNADNVYIVKRGEGTLTVEDKTYIIRENDVVYHPRRHEPFALQSERGRIRDFRDLRAGRTAHRFRLDE